MTNTDIININEKGYKYKIRDDRPTFYYENKENNEIRAGGIIYFRYNSKINDVEFLMIKCNDKYEDFGGKTDKIDMSIEETVAREAEEESNNIFKKENTMNSIGKCKIVYTRNSKYIVYLIKTNEDYKCEEFGDKEIYENIPRTVEWISSSKLLDPEFINTKLHIRLKHKFFSTMINKIKNENVNMFIDE